MAVRSPHVMQLEGREERDAGSHGLRCTALAQEESGLPRAAEARPLCVPGLYAGLGRADLLVLGPWPCHMGRATVLPLVPVLPWASHCGPATLSCHITGDNQWAWVSVAHQGQRQPAQEPMCSPWIAT